MNCLSKTASISYFRKKNSFGEISPIVLIEGDFIPVFSRVGSQDNFVRDISILSDSDLLSPVFNGQAYMTHTSVNGRFKCSFQISNPCLADIYNFINTPDSWESSVLESLKIIHDVSDFCQKTGMDYPKGIPVGASLIWAEIAQ